MRRMHRLTRRREQEDGSCTPMRSASGTVLVIYIHFQFVEFAIPDILALPFRDALGKIRSDIAAECETSVHAC